jgi:hypothetical protein
MRAPLSAGDIHYLLQQVDVPGATIKVPRLVLWKALQAFSGAESYLQKGRERELAYWWAIEQASALNVAPKGFTTTARTGLSCRLASAWRRRAFWRWSDPLSRGAWVSLSFSRLFKSIARHSLTFLSDVSCRGTKFRTRFVPCRHLLPTHLGRGTLFEVCLAEHINAPKLMIAETSVPRLCLSIDLTSRWLGRSRELQA